jgi:hypothetical protein
VTSVTSLKSFNPGEIQYEEYDIRGHLLLAGHWLCAYENRENCGACIS